MNNFSVKLNSIIKKEKIKYLVFDFDGVLFYLNTDYQVLKEELNKLAVKLKSRENFGSIWLTIDKILATLPVNQRLSVRKKFVALITKYELLAVDRAVGLSGTKGVLESLVAQSLPFAILSRNTEELISRLWRKNKLPQFDQLITVNNVSWVKPHPEGLKLILKKAKVKKNRVLIIGDTSHDIDLAEKVGLKSVLVINKINQKYPNIKDLAQKANWRINLIKN